MNLTAIGHFFKTHKLLILVVILLSAVLTPHLVGDGTTRFTGEKQEVAERVLDKMYSSEHGISQMLRIVDPFVYQYYVEDVYPASSEKSELRAEDDKVVCYEARISEVTLFGFRKNVGETHEMEGDCYLRQKALENSESAS